MTETERRDGSRLEQDDPQYCKECGGRINVDHTQDAQGRPLTWLPSEGDFEALEICSDCWVDERLEELAGECMERYDGECPEVLWRR